MRKNGSVVTISQPKIAGFTPRWAPFPGFSLLFDSPSSAYRENSGLEHLTCSVAADSRLEFYRRARTSLEKLNLDRLLQTYLFCALPPESYHVTAFDVANLADLTRCKGDCLELMRELLTPPIDGDRFSHPILHTATMSALATRRWEISFRCKTVRIWGQVMVVELIPFGPGDEAKFSELMNLRLELNRAYLDGFGIGAGPKLTPHLSLGYFANGEGAELAAARLPAWNEAISASLTDLPLTFETISMHGFNTMAEFFRVAVQ